MRAAVIVTAAGKSQRFGGIKKEYASIGDTTVLRKSLSAFLFEPRIECFVIVIAPGNERAASDALKEDAKRVHFVAGSDSRQGSVLNALRFLQTYNPDLVLIHDGARPFCTRELVTRVLDAVVEKGAAIPLVPTVDTLKESDESFKIVRHLRRANVKAAQTPQGFLYTDLLKAHEYATKDCSSYTDDAEIFARYAGSVWGVEGDPANRKITFPGDLR